MAIPQTIRNCSYSLPTQESTDGPQLMIAQDLFDFIMVPKCTHTTILVFTFSTMSDILHELLTISFHKK
jgi:hypothetical protein